MKCLRQYADESQMWAAIENDDKLRKKVLGGLKGCDEKSLAADHLASLPQQFSSCQSGRSPCRTHRTICIHGPIMYNVLVSHPVRTSCSGMESLTSRRWPRSGMFRA